MSVRPRRSVAGAGVDHGPVAGMTCGLAAPHAAQPEHGGRNHSEDHMPNQRHPRNAAKAEERGIARDPAYAP